MLRPHIGVAGHHPARRPHHLRPAVPTETTGRLASSLSGGTPPAGGYAAWPAASLTLTPRIAAARSPASRSPSSLALPASVASRGSSRPAPRAANVSKSVVITAAGSSAGPALIST